MFFDDPAPSPVTAYEWENAALQLGKAKIAVSDAKAAGDGVALALALGAELAANRHMDALVARQNEVDVRERLRTFLPRG